jgi:hypothetical protein
MIRLSFDPTLVEEAVLLAERRMPAEDARAFRRDRDQAYSVEDADEGEARFRALHMRWFRRRGLCSTIEETVRERPEVAFALTEGRVVRALTSQEERADLIDWIPPHAADPQPMLVLRLRPAIITETEILRRLLRHELLHVADMLSPAFGYERALPPSDDGPSHDNILRDRYRVLWDVTVDGRLVRSGLLGGHAREARWSEFRSVFRMSSEQGRRVFDEWFDLVQPTHAELLAFVSSEHANGSTRRTADERCPLCRFPVATLDRFPERLSVAARKVIQTTHPAWSLEQGLCTQCLDLYEAHNEEARVSG